MYMLKNTDNYFLKFFDKTFSMLPACVDTENQRINEAFDLF